jgi:hypothetical protein
VSREVFEGPGLDGVTGRPASPARIYRTGSLTGRTRHRTLLVPRLFRRPLRHLVLQVEYRNFDSDVSISDYLRRDARTEDLGEVEVLSRYREGLAP